MLLFVVVLQCLVVCLKRLLVVVLYRVASSQVIHSLRLLQVIFHFVFAFLVTIYRHVYLSEPEVAVPKIEG